MSASSQRELWLQMKNIVKYFPGVCANDHINLDVAKGEIHVLLGENGTGKTTLMNVLCGLYQPQQGQIFLEGHEVQITSPRKAMDLGIGMIHQHFTLIPSLSVTENVILGNRQYRRPILDFEEVANRIEELSAHYGFQVDHRMKVSQLSVGAQQKVEIIKTLCRRTRLLIMDEPTSALTPQEVKELFAIMRSLTEQGLTIISITHKLHEAMRIGDRATVLRDGKVVASSVPIRTTNESELARMMIGRNYVSYPKSKPIARGNVLLTVEGIWTLSRDGQQGLKGVSFDLHTGEVLGIAGVDGNGQAELVKTIIGLCRVIRGRIILDGCDITHCTPREIIEQEVAYILADRHRTGLVTSASVLENAILKNYYQPPFARRGVLALNVIQQYVNGLIANYDIRVSNGMLPAKVLSGGNQQKLILARELALTPRLLLADQPTRGLDIWAAESIRRRISQAKERGCAVLLVSNELEEILSLSDRIMVMYEGRIAGEVMAEKANVEEIGLMMSNKSA